MLNAHDAHLPSFFLYGKARNAIAIHAASAPQLVAPKLSSAFFANIDVHLRRFIRRSGCCDLQSQEQPGWGHPQAQAGTFASQT
jgi:hypothetical protein